MALPELLGNSPSIGVAQALTTLSGAMTSGQATVPVNGAAPAALQGTGQFRIVIGSEIIIVDASTSSSGTSWTVVTRGAEGSTAAAHSAGDNVYHVLTAGGLGAYALQAANNLSDVAAQATARQNLGIRAGSATFAFPGGTGASTTLAITTGLSAVTAFTGTAFESGLNLGYINIVSISGGTVNAALIIPGGTPTSGTNINAEWIAVGT